MANKRESGFTLVEIVVVIAISAALVTIVFAGQRQVRQRARFDAAVEKLVSSVATAHSDATNGLNVSGNGRGNTACDGSLPGAGSLYLFGGTAWSAKDDAAGMTIEIDSYAVEVDKDTLERNNGQPCLLGSKAVTVPAVLRVGLAPPNHYWRVAFVRDDSGGIAICSHHSNGAKHSASVTKSYKSGGCEPPDFNFGGMTFRVSDSAGHTSDIQIDSNGLARRLN